MNTRSFYILALLKQYPSSQSFLLYKLCSEFDWQSCQKPYYPDTSVPHDAHEQCNGGERPCPGSLNTPDRTSLTIPVIFSTRS